MTAESLITGFETVLKHDGPKVEKKVRSLATREETLDSYTQQLKGNYYLQEFKLIIDRQAPDFLKFDAIFNKLAIALPICTNRVHKQS